uniref:Brevinin-1-RAA5 peptide n=1 Tax=Odorrana andersonii TaxID=369514 RepID=E3SYD2_ODOAN|nr:brevinin-1-RAA5 peptide precursor [Odorrana andersonii]ADP05718.1 brevinin-1-RAA5 peptide precursor [Odorrana andersonii]ADP05719.1 brevinin-1-RAA5 peptide precursor [Odorrana andersonii]ADP05720.1 brevinin-1-RAA5 peptide precursor [Odorrana andersonii]ADP05721.1 brevinin-1-RAA5 peptide precursor [Odorrana andersonii]
MFTMKKPLLLLFFLGTINLSLCQEERNAEEERRDDSDEMNAEVEKRFLPAVIRVAANVLPTVFCAISKKC